MRIKVQSEKFKDRDKDKREDSLKYTRQDNKHQVKLIRVEKNAGGKQGGSVKPGVTHWERNFKTGNNNNRGSQHSKKELEIHLYTNYNRK